MPAPVITSEELYLLREAILLPLMLKMIETSLLKMEESSNTMKRAYLMTGEYIAMEVRAELARIEQHLRVARIVYWEKGSTQHVIVYRYVCRGAEEFVSIPRDEVREELSVRFGNYTGALGAMLENGRKAAYRV